MPARRHQLEALTGRPEDDRGRLQRVIDGLRTDIVDASAADAVTYTPASAADWNGTPPATVGEALDRIAAMLGPIT